MAAQQPWHDIYTRGQEALSVPTVQCCLASKQTATRHRHLVGVPWLRGALRRDGHKVLGICQRVLPGGKFY